MSEGKKCHYCPTTNDLRPYGPGGAYVCFLCATSSKDREEETASAFGTLLDATEAISPNGPVVIGYSEDGPLPFDPEMLAPSPPESNE